METPHWNAVGVVYAAIIGITFVMLVLSIPYGIYAVFYTHLSTSTPPLTSQTSIGSLPIYIGLLTINLPVTPTFGVLFLGLTGIFVACIILAFAQGGGFGRALLSTMREGIGALMQNPLSSMIMILGATLLATVILQAFQTSVGVQTGGLSGDPFLLLMDFTLSPLIEEIGYRFFLIGVPLAVLLLATRPTAKKLLRTLWRPSAAWEQEAQPDAEHIQVPTDTLKNFTYLLIALSSVIFGLAHYLSGAGWDVGKISEAALDGVALAYVYVRYGIHASILFHWAVDYASNAFAFYAQGVYGISWTANSAYSLIPEYVILFLVGIPGLLYFINIFLKHILKPRHETIADDSSRQINPG